jgi:DNA-binding MarR family transcriptional regulator
MPPSPKKPGGPAAPDAASIADHLTLHALLLKLRRSVVETLQTHMPHPEFGPIETVLLRVVQHAPKDTDTLRALAALDMVSFSKSIKLLHKRDLIETYSGTRDRRRKLYGLTIMGEQAADSVTQATQRTEQAFLAPLGARDRALLMRLLPKLTLAHAVRGAVPQDPRIVDVLGGWIDPGTLLRRALQISAQFYDQNCGTLNLSPLEAAALHSIDAFGPVAVKDLPRLLSIDRGSAFAIVAKLIDRDCLDADAYRDRRLSLSAAGRGLHAVLSPRLLDTEAQFLDVLTKAEGPRLMRVIRRLHIALSADPRAAP